MAVIESLLQFLSTGTLLGALLLLLVLYLLSSGSRSQKEGKEPPGPKPLPLLGNLLTFDLKRPFDTLCELSRTYGNVFQVFLGPKKVVVLAGHKTVKKALVNFADDPASTAMWGPNGFDLGYLTGTQPVLSSVSM
ncbi:unnamed protein product [Leuciscus chuanchicus]